MLTQHSLRGPRQTRELQLQNEVTQLSAQGGRKKLEVNTVSLLLRASHPALAGGMMVTKGFLQAPAELRAGQGAGEKASGPGWGNTEKRGWQPLGKTTTKEERMCLWRKGDKGDPGAVRQRT